MERAVKFIHTADIHLGKNPVGSGILPAELNLVFSRATEEAFVRISNVAIANQVDFILIAGDLYDRESRSIAANQFFNEECRRLARAGIEVYLINGNHDPARIKGELLELPPNLHLFNSKNFEAFDVRKEGETIARIIGRSYPGRAEGRKIGDLEGLLENNIWNIGLIHTQLDASENNYLPCSLAELISTKIDYWALGHIHKPEILYYSKEKAVAYAGTPQGRDFGEQGIGGALLINLLPQSYPEISFLPVSPLVYLVVEVKIDQGRKINNLTELEKEIVARVEKVLNQTLHRRKLFPNKVFKDREVELYSEGIVEGYVLQIVISGRGPVSNILQEQREEALEYLADSVNRVYHKGVPFVWINRIIDRTGKPFDNYKALLKHPLISEITRFKNRVFQEPDIYNELLEYLGQIWIDYGHPEDYDPFRFQLNKQQLEDILEQAQQKIIEELLSRRGSL